MGLDTSTSCKEVEKSTHLGFAWFFGNAKSRDCWDGVLRRRGDLASSAPCAGLSTSCRSVCTALVVELWSKFTLNFKRMLVACITDSSQQDRSRV